ncbi:MAG TPA: hypothetical protein VMM35_05005 [Longimicrobiales bacterium]|nr:hypothetical protein [Longimicrobiales bacterium]
MSQDRHGAHGPHEVKEPVGWMDRPEAVKRFFTVFYVVCGALLLAELLLINAENAHPHPLEEAMRFLVYPVYGFVSFWFLVLVAKPMRRLLIRPEDYYERDGEDAKGGAGHE